MGIIAKASAVLETFLLLLGGEVARAQAVDLTKVNLADLMNIEVTSVSKKEQKLSRTASAVFVITQEDILHSGATNLPDLLRMAPGVDVAQINANTWAISVRGFNGQVSNKLLVLIDGRTVYSPMFSGVFWDALDVPLENIDRIEIIRGPGATVWGANAVNGVISVITKKANDTQGGLLDSGGGTREPGFGTARFGRKLGNSGSYRIFADGFAMNHLPDLAAHYSNDSWHLIHGGFRADANATTRDSISLQGDAHTGDTGGTAASIYSAHPITYVPFVLSGHISGWDLLSTWEHEVSPRSATSLQVYFDRDMRDEALYGFGLNTFDLDFQHHVGWGSRQDIVWGIDYRVSSDETLASARMSFNPASRTTELFSSFIQDEFSVVPDRVYISLGAKLEHNEYTGFGIQPSARMSWTPSSRNMFWTAISGAERTPARSDTDVRTNFISASAPNGIPVLISLVGNPEYKNEALRAFEAGYRTELSKRISLDSSVFFNHYRDLNSVEPGNPFPAATPAPHIVVPTSLSNLNYGETHGLEVYANWNVTNHWTLSPGYSYLTMHIHRESSSHDLTTAPETEGSSPNHQAQLRSHLDLPAHWGWNSSAYFVGRISAQAIPSYTRLDTNVVWQLAERFSFTLAGENLLRDRHTEYTGSDSIVSSSQIKRSAYAKITWQF